MDHERGRSRSRSFIADEEETGTDDVDVEIEKNIRLRGRLRSHSFSDYSSGEEATPTSRRRSRSFVSENGSSSDEGESSRQDAVAKATSMSKLYLAGSKPIDPNSLPKPKQKRNTKKQTGALSKKALGALSEGLQSSVRLNDKQLTEAEVEENKLAEQEASQLKDDKAAKKTVTATSRAKQLANKAAGFKSRFLGGMGSRSSTTDESITEAPPRPKKKHKLKLLLLGDSGVGKTSLIRVFSGDPFSESMLATAGVDFKLRNITIEEEEVALQVWDTAGQERFHRITTAYYKGANGIVLVYDVNDRKGFDNVGYWMNNIQQNSQQMPAMLLVGNKIDLPNRAVSPEEGLAAASQYHCRFLGTSIVSLFPMYTSNPLIL